MNKKILTLTGSLLCLIWGISHLIPTKSVVAGFGNISMNNQRIVFMEWINEGLTLIFIGLLVTVIAIASKENTSMTRIVYLISSIMLFSMAVLSLLTGFNIDFLPFKLCPLIFSVSGLLILQSAWPVIRRKSG